MSNQLKSQEISRLSDAHPKPPQLRYQYGTAGFRTLCVYLDLISSRCSQQVIVEDLYWTLFFFEWVSSQVCGARNWMEKLSA